jgi:preprotein translocase subunit YajC
MTYLIVEQFAPLAAGSLPFVVILFLKLRAQREQRKQGASMLRHLKRECPEEFAQ